jgi:hypothetical protein
MATLTDWYRLGDDHSDLTIRCQGREYRAHRGILASRCKFFDASESSTIAMNDDNPDALESLLIYLYTVNTDHIAFRNVSHGALPKGYFRHLILVSWLAEKYDLPLLRDSIADISSNDKKGNKIACKNCYERRQTCIDREDYGMTVFEALGMATSLAPRLVGLVEKQQAASDKKAFLKRLKSPNR